MKIAVAAVAAVTTLAFIGRSTTDAFAPSRVLHHESSKRSSVIVCHDNKNRRDVMAHGAALPFFFSQKSASAATTASSSDLLADLPMVRLRLPPQGLGREYVAIKMKINGKGPFDFMVDTGLTTELVTPHLQQTLGIGGYKSSLKGIAAGGSTGGGDLVELSDASICCGTFQDSTKDELALPLLHAIVTDFPQEHIDPQHDPVEGMLGMEMLEQFDVDFDFPKNRLRLWKAGTFDQDPSRIKGLVQIPAAVINETGLIGIRVLSTQQSTPQPILGFLDCGSTFSAVNWAAAGYLGLPPKQDASYRGTPQVMALGVDGRPQQMPTHKLQFSFVGAADKTKSSSSAGIVFEQPPSEWKPWAPTQIAIGDIPAFSEMLSPDGKTPYTGPAALIGLDVLAQRRVVLESGRRRSVWVSAK